MRWSLRRAETVVVLDRFMAERVQEKAGANHGGRAGRRAPAVVTIPPGARGVRYDEAGRRAFRERHGLEGKFVVMYSGNHSPCHPLETLLEAAERLRDDASIRFVFAGGGTEQPKAAARGLANVLVLGYQAEETLAGSLSAADLHAVVMGEPFVGIVHPSKIYNVLAVGIPVLYIGPAESHVTEIARDGDGAGGPRWFHAARHGDAEAVVSHILAARAERAFRTESELAAAERFTRERTLAALAAAITGERG
jgi:glycosyltransferase involved in cell wall biosynthesis